MPVEFVGMPKTEEWKTARFTGLGASDIAAAVGCNPWKTALELYLDKRQEVPPFEGNDATHWGELLEDDIISHFCGTTGESVAVAPCGMYRRSDKPWMLATPDCILNSEALLEAKTTLVAPRQGLADNGWGEELTDQVPEHYLCQCQWQMEVMGFNLCHLGLLVNGRQFLHFRVERDQDLIETLTDIGWDFWRRVEKGEPPDPDCQHPSTPNLLKQLYGSTDGTLTTLSAKVQQAWERYKLTQAHIKDLKSEAEAARNLVVAALGTHFAAPLDSGGYLRRKVIAEQSISTSYTKEAYVDLRWVKRLPGLTFDTV